MQHDSTGQAGAHQGGEIEITGEMIDAGVRELLLLLGDVVPETTRSLNERVVSAVFYTMAEASPSKG